jgi:hypothetical protein
MLSLPLATPLLAPVAHSQPQTVELSYDDGRALAVVDPVTGLLIHPLTGVVIDLENVLYDPVLATYIDAVTGALIPMDGSIPGLPVLQPDSAPPKTLEGFEGVASTTGEGSSVRVPLATASPEAPALPGAHAPPPDARGPATILSNHERDSQPGTPLPKRVRDQGGSHLVLTSPAAVIAGVVDAVLDGSHSLDRAQAGVTPDAPAP